MNRFKGLFLLTTAITVMLVGCEQPRQNPESLVTIQQYNQLENRAEFEDVIDLLGQPDYINFEENTADEVKFDDEFTRYSWDGVAPNSKIALHFRDGKLYKKEKRGFE
ncbi:hypothetical protein SAMN05216232_2609 [Virgibacillus subterraneus]|uniref:DUF3862 domain-containing protein n=1 Tax=Virgibacillus subterraneus TaxID=621109 RepID=A0A1H9GH70_9BACI|nr:hypothetical protein [Virgibacillus subterraneus]SEQ49406.1 hypothetical protein SAMN05216232_2609 [Virgibacillus subterraneus]